MKKIKSSSRLLFVSLFILVFSIILFTTAAFSSKPQALHKLTTSLNPCPDNNCPPSYFLTEQKVMEELFKTEEPSIIYSRVLSKYSESSPNNQHGIAHIFGELLYKNLGLKGVTICDNSFAFGCFHGFFVNAIAKEGIDSIKELDQMCIEKYGPYNLGCQHGLGHGLAEYYGSANLEKSLETCASLSWKHQLMGCSGGVFMEYIMPTLGGNTPGSVLVKPINQNTPYSPCTEIKEHFKPECYYNLGNYFYHGTNQNVKEALTLCEKLSDKLNKQSCLFGLGNSIYSNIRDIDKTIASCQLASTKESEINCRSGAAWILYTNVSTRPDANKLCADLAGKQLQSCQAQSNLLKIALEI